MAERLVDEDGRLPKELPPEQLQEMREASAEARNYVQGVKQLISNGLRLFRHPR